MKKAKRKFLKEGSSPNVVEKDYDDDGAFDENKKIDAETKKIMKTGKMAPQPDRDEPKIKMRCGNKFAAGGLAAKKFLKFVKKGKYTDKTWKKK
jgi:aspartate-semialdehyde dehydrogenase